VTPQVLAFDFLGISVRLPLTPRPVAQALGVAVAGVLAGCVLVSALVWLAGAL
jgi:hypothetical protein